MKRVRLTSLVLAFFALIGCGVAPYEVARAGRQEASNGYCHKKLQPVGPSDFARPNQPSGDYIDYYGPCDGPSPSEQAEQQRRFEQFRFGREYMDEG